MLQLFPLVRISLKTENFTYLGSNISFSGDLTNDIQRRIGLASSAFGRLSKRVFENQNLAIHTKIAIYNAVVFSTILCGCTTWVPYRRHISLLESFHIRRLQLFFLFCFIISWTSLVAQSDSFWNWINCWDSINRINAPPSPAPLVGPCYQNASQQTAPSCALWPSMTRSQECWWTKETLKRSQQVDP